MRKWLIVSLVLCVYGMLMPSLLKGQDMKTYKNNFPTGEKISPNPHFLGDVWLQKLTSNDSLGVPMYNVTFAPACRNSWHKHSQGQILIATAGVGYYQEKGKPARLLTPGDVVEIPSNILHWHGAAPGSWFSHIAITCHPSENEVTWLDPVTDAAYRDATQPSSWHEQNITALSSKEKAIVAIAACTAQGTEAPLTRSLEEALQVGMTVNEIKEVLVHSYAYCGFPRSLKGIQTFMSLLDARKKKGITDVPGKESEEKIMQTTKYEQGQATLALLTGIAQQNQSGGYAAFVPVIDKFLKEHLFADLFNRTLLSYRERELATLAVLSTLGNVVPMIQGHLNIARHLGVSHTELLALAQEVETNLGTGSAAEFRKVLNENK